MSSSSDSECNAIPTTHSLVKDHPQGSLMLRRTTLCRRVYIECFLFNDKLVLFSVFGFRSIKYILLQKASFECQTCEISFLPFPEQASFPFLLWSEYIRTS